MELEPKREMNLRIIRNNKERSTILDFVMGKNQAWEVTVNWLTIVPYQITVVSLM